MSIQSPNNGTISEINITPLVDVMLVLLIIFMVAAPVLEKERSQKELDENRDRQQRLIALNLPVLDNSGSAPAASKVLRLTVDNALAVRLDGEALASCGKGGRDFESWVPCWDEIQSKLTSGASAKAAKEGGVAVDASDLVPFGFTVGVLHRIYRANIDKVSLFPTPGM